MSTPAQQPQTCDRPGCQEPPRQVYLVGEGGESVLVTRCTPHLHADGHFSKEEYETAIAILRPYIDKQAAAMQAAWDDDDIRTADKLQWPLLWARGVLMELKCKAGITL